VCDPSSSIYSTSGGACVLCNLKIDFIPNETACSASSKIGFYDWSVIKDPTKNEKMTSFKAKLLIDGWQYGDLTPLTTTWIQTNLIGAFSSAGQDAEFMPAITIDSIPTVISDPLEIEFTIDITKGSYNDSMFGLTMIFTLADYSLLQDAVNEDYITLVDPQTTPSDVEFQYCDPKLGVLDDICLACTTPSSFPALETACNQYPNISFYSWSVEADPANTNDSTNYYGKIKIENYSYPDSTPFTARPNIDSDFVLTFADPTLTANVIPTFQITNIPATAAAPYYLDFHIVLDQAIDPWTSN